METKKQKEPEMKPLFEDMGVHTKVEKDTAGLKKALEHQQKSSKPKKD